MRQSIQVTPGYHIVLFIACNANVSQNEHIRNQRSGCEEKGVSRFNLVAVTTMQWYYFSSYFFFHCFYQQFRNCVLTLFALFPSQDKNGNPPGIVRDEDVDPLPSLFKQMIKRMVRWHVLPPTCVPNSCIVNIYEAGDCIPPHIDHHDFVRPFCTVSFLTECNILFGASLKVVDAGEFSGPVSIPLPVG